MSGTQPRRGLRAKSRSGDDDQPSRRAEGESLVLVRLVSGFPVACVLGEPTPLAPHRARPTVQPLHPVRPAYAVPTVLLSYEAYCDTMHLIAAAGIRELAWLGAVKELPGKRYLIERIFLVRQRAGFEECTLDTMAIGQFYHEMLRKDRAHAQLLQRLRFWGHLHPLDTVPSALDERQMRIFADRPWFIRGIFTRFGQGSFAFFDYRRGVKVVDCPWSIFVEDSGRKQALAEEVREKVVRLPVVILKGGSSDDQTPTRHGRATAKA